MKKLKNIIYITGYGRSGSTLLEKLLQCQPSFHATGELVNFFRFYNSSKKRCSCGKRIQDCDFWSSVAKELFKNGFNQKEFLKYAKIQRKHEALWTHGGSLVLKNNKKYLELMRKFFDAVAQIIGPEESFLIDSSKTAYTTLYRPIALSRLGEYKVRVIHLVRDCRGVAWSVKKGLNRRMENGEKGRVALPVLRAMLGWAFSNMAAGNLKNHIGQDNYYLIRYEDLVENPVYTLKMIGLFLKVDLDRCIHTAQKAREGYEVQLPEIHQLAGNRMRFSYSLSISPDYAWKEKLNSQTKAFIKIIAMPLMRKYGYL